MPPRPSVRTLPVVHYLAQSTYSTSDITGTAPDPALRFPPSEGMGPFWGSCPVPRETERADQREVEILKWLYGQQEEANKHVRQDLLLL